jgi:hypothetical protein
LCLFTLDPAIDLDSLEADNTGLQNQLNGSYAHPADIRPVHIETYEIFKVWANEAFNGAFPKTISPRYTSAYALLLYWSEDDLGVATEATCLQRVFEDQYNFETDTYLIPSSDSEQLLVQRIFEFRKKHAAPENLLIIYYGGHAEQAEHDHCIWRRFVVPPLQIKL